MALIFNVNGCGFKGFTVPAVPAMIAGIYRDGNVWTPDKAAVRAGLPHRYRAAFDRDGLFWWPKETNRQGYCELVTRRGKRVVVYANIAEG